MILKCDLDMVMIYLCAENEAMVNVSNIIAQTDRHTERHTHIDIQTCLKLLPVADVRGHKGHPSGPKFLYFHAVFGKKLVK